MTTKTTTQAFQVKREALVKQVTVIYAASADEALAIAQSAGSA